MQLQEPAIFTGQLKKRKHIMAIYETNRSVPFGAITTYRLINVLERAKTSIVEWNSKRLTRNALAKLSDRELDDIGLIRGDLDSMPSSITGLRF